MSQTFDDVTNNQQSQILGVTARASKEPQAALTQEVGRKRRQRPSLKVRENSAQSGEEGSTIASRQEHNTTAHINNEAASASLTSKPKKNKTTKAAKAKDKFDSGATASSKDISTLEHHGTAPSSFIADTALLRHDNTDFQPRLHFESLRSNSQLLTQPPRHTEPKSLHHPPTKEVLPWHVTRWHALGFKTFETGNIDPDTGEQEYRVVLRDGKLENSLAFWYEHIVGGIALKYGQKKGVEQGEILYNSISDVALAIMHARDADVPKMLVAAPGAKMPAKEPEPDPRAVEQTAMQHKQWDYLLEAIKHEASAWKAQRRSRWEGTKLVQKEVRARRSSRGDFVVDEDEDSGARSDVAIADGDEGENVLAAKVELGYHRETSELGCHWMSREEVQKIISPREVLRSRVVQLGMQQGKMRYKVLYCPLQSPCRSNTEKGLDFLEQRMEGLRICRKGKLQKVFEQIERGAFSLKRVAQDRVEGKELRALTALV